MAYPLGTERRQEVETPDWILALIAEHWGPKWFDPCPYPRPKGYDSLDRKVKWGKLNYCNPPYNNIAPFVDRAIEETKQGHTTLMLIPARLNMRYMAEKVWGEYEIIPILGEVRFKTYTNTLPGTLILIVFSPGSPYKYPRYIKRPIDVSGKSWNWSEKHGIPGELIVKRKVKSQLLK